jgi:hypothetical protein
LTRLDYHKGVIARLTHPMTMLRLTTVGGIGGYRCLTISQRYPYPDRQSVSTSGPRGVLDHVASGWPGLWSSALR